MIQRKGTVFRNFKTLVRRGFLTFDFVPMAFIYVCAALVLEIDGVIDMEVAESIAPIG